MPSLPSYVGRKITEKHIRYVTQVEIDGEILGTLLVKSDMVAIRAEQKRSLAIASLLFIAGLGLAASIAYRMQKYVTIPLADLSDIALSVSREKDYTKRAKKSYDDEIGALVDGFNFMMESVHLRDLEIQNHNKNLEAEVAERTMELKSAMIEAQQASQAKSDFLSTMSHELRTPMNAIVGMTSLVMKSEMDDEMRGHLEIVCSSSDNLLALINDVLDYSKIESGKLELESQPFDLVSCLESAMDLVAAQSRDGSRLFVTSIDPTLPGTITGDLTRLRQIAVNLLGNAAKFTHKGHIWLEAKKTLENELRISVHDTGIGIPKDRLNRLFRSFSQVDTSTTRKYGGTGLGLAISQKLATGMGGEIVVKSEEGVGTTFSFDLPIITDAPELLVGSEPPASMSVEVIGFDDPLKSSIRGILSAWEENRENASEVYKLRIQSAIADSENEALRLAKDSGSPSSDYAPTIIVSHIEHTNALKAECRGRLLTLPLKISDLRRMIATLTFNNNKGENKGPSETEKTKPAYFDPNLRILLTEDNKVNQKVFKIIMKREGIAVDIANNGQEAYDAVSKKDYDIVFMDLQMPVMGGIDSCKLIRAEGNRIHQPWIIGFSANVEVDAIPAMRAVGMNDFLAKPVKDTDVRRKLAFYTDQDSSNQSFVNSEYLS